MRNPRQKKLPNFHTYIPHFLPKRDAGGGGGRRRREKRKKKEYHENPVNPDVVLSQPSTSLPSTSRFPLISGPKLPNHWASVPPMPAGKKEAPAWLLLVLVLVLLLLLLSEEEERRGLRFRVSQSSSLLLLLLLSNVEGVLVLAAYR